jgi:hypothetical protein
MEIRDVKTARVSEDKIMEYNKKGAKPNYETMPDGVKSAPYTNSDFDMVSYYPMDKSELKRFFSFDSRVK